MTCTRSHPHEHMNGYCRLRTEIARLENEAANRDAELDRVKNRYSARLERMAGLAALMPEPVKTAFWNVYANGTASPSENPTYEQRVNILQHQRNGLLSSLETLVAAVELGNPDRTMDAVDEAKVCIGWVK